MQVLYQLCLREEVLPRALAKAMATLNSTMPLIQAFHEECVTSESLARLEALAVRNVEVWTIYDEDRIFNKKVHSSCHCVDAVSSAGAAHEYCTAQFEKRHKHIRLVIAQA